MADAAELQEQLTEAEDILHKLATGQKVVEVDYDGHSHKYNQASLPELRRHVRGLRRKLGLPVGGSVGRVTF